MRVRLGVHINMLHAMVPLFKNSIWLQALIYSSGEDFWREHWYKTLKINLHRTSSIQHKPVPP